MLISKKKKKKYGRTVVHKKNQFHCSLLNWDLIGSVDREIQPETFLDHDHL